MRRHTERRHIEFHPSPGGALERIVTRPDGQRYTHRCSEAVFTDLARYLDDHVGQELTCQGVATEIGATYSNVQAGWDLLLERGMLVDANAKRKQVASGYRSAFFEHAMTEFYAIIEGHPPEMSSE